MTTATNLYHSNNNNNDGPFKVRYHCNKCGSEGFTYYTESEIVDDKYYVVIEDGYFVKAGERIPIRLENKIFYCSKCYQASDLTQTMVKELKYDYWNWKLR